jgi:hypothetical protein
MHGAYATKHYPLCALACCTHTETHHVRRDWLPKEARGRYTLNNNVEDKNASAIRDASRTAIVHAVWREHQQFFESKINPDAESGSGLYKTDADAKSKIRNHISK